jgi:diguanylate cyclase (GGDEF)-like protein/PAS domain S-box-containing protein
MREQARLAAVRALAILDTPAESTFDDLTVLAARIAGVPTALISVMDAERQWFKSRVGLDVCSTIRDVAFCDVVVRSEQELEVVDATKDVRFAENPLVTGAPGIVSYAGFPLAMQDGLVVGTLCVIGYQPHALDDEQRQALRVLARQVVTQLELRRLTAEQAAELTLRRGVEVELEISRRQYRLLAEHSSDIISRHQLDGRVTYVSPAVHTVLGYSPAEEISENAKNHVHPDDLELMASALSEVAQGSQATTTVRSQHADGSWRYLEVTLSPLVDPELGVVEVYSAARDATERVEAAKALERSLALIQAVLDNIPVGIVACDELGSLTLFNPATREFHGMSADARLDASDWADHYALYQSDGVTALASEDIPLRRALAGEQVQDVEIVIAPRGLPARLVSCAGQELRGSTGQLLGAVVTMTDITKVRESEQRLRTANAAQRRATEALTRSEAQFREIFESGPMPILRLDESGRVLNANPAFRHLVALRSAAIVGKRMSSFVLPSDRQRLDLTVASAGTIGPDHVVEARIRMADGTPLWCELAMSSCADVQGRGGVLVQLADIHARKHRELELERRAAHDALTHLPNRSALYEHLHRLLQAPERKQVSVLFADLDGFKAINDEHGHKVGDQVLTQVAQRLQAAVRADDMVARLGGDEFVIVQTSELDMPANVQTLIDRITTALAQPVQTGAEPQHVHLSIGTCTAQDGQTVDDLLSSADRAMYQAKRSTQRPAAGMTATPGPAVLR